MAAPKTPTDSDAEKRQQLRKAFSRESIGLLPKITCRDCADKNNRSKVCKAHSKKKCPDCGNYITIAHMHLDYVGHAAVTDRLLSIDPNWTWKPMATSENGLPVGDGDKNLWIELTILGVTRPGVGDGANMKERIGDAIRNGAMRFGVALDLWSKEELESVVDDPSLKNDKPSAETRDPADVAAEEDEARRMVELSDDLFDLLKTRYPAKRIRATIESLTTVEDREKAILSLTRKDEKVEEDAPIDLGADVPADQPIDMEAEGQRYTEDEESPEAELADAKRHIVGMLSEIGIEVAVKQRSFIYGVLNQSTIDTLEQADLVARHIESIQKERAESQPESEA